MTESYPFHLYNTATRSKEQFTPQHDRVGLYCCGPTVYNYAHIGNLRTYIFEDVLKRTLLALGHNVLHVVNITDVGHLTSDQDTGEDKMEKGARREGKSVWDIAARFTDAFMRDIGELNILFPDIWPKATEHIPQMIDLVKTLVDRGFTYTTSDGIYFDTAKFPDYTKFARLNPENMRAGERVDMGDKRNITDFALWKFSPADKKRQMEWESPWGTGFPGWHIECSAMSLAYLPQPIDIHCGGADHIRVHHTNEIAQAEAATGKQFVRFWMHGEFLVLGKDKMAKSGGTFVTMDALRGKGIDPLAYRMFCYTAHYRTPLSFSWESLQSAGQSLNNLRRSVGQLRPEEENHAIPDSEVDAVLVPFYRALCDDLNVPRGMAALWEFIRDESLSPALRFVSAARADEVLGLDLTMDQTDSIQSRTGEDGVTVYFESTVDVPPVVQEQLTIILSDRRKARHEKDFTTADTIRDRLNGLGIEVKDQADGSTMVVVPVSVCESGGLQGV